MTTYAYAPTGALITNELELTWTSGRVVFDEFHNVGDSYHDDHPDYESWAPMGRDAFSDYDGDEWLHSHLRWIDMEDDLALVDDEHVAAWPDEVIVWCREELLARNTAELANMLKRHGSQALLDETCHLVLDAFVIDKCKAAADACEAKIMRWKEAHPELCVVVFPSEDNPANLDITKDNATV